MLIISIKIFLYKHLHPNLHISGLMIEYTSTPEKNEHDSYKQRLHTYTCMGTAGHAKYIFPVEHWGEKIIGGIKPWVSKKTRVVVTPLTGHYDNHIVPAFHGIPALPGAPGGPAPPPKEAYNCAACTCCNRCISSGVLCKHNRIKS